MEQYAIPTTIALEQSALLRLPGELRNQIYRHALLSESPVAVTNQGFKEPPLLLACCQLRREAIGVFYEENEFYVYIPSYNSANLMKWTKKARVLHKEHGVEAKCEGTTDCKIPNWKNPKRWLKRYHNGSVFKRILPPSQLPVDSSLDEHFLGGLFEVVEGMDDKSWAEVEHVVDEQHHFLVRFNQAWK